MDIRHTPARARAREFTAGFTLIEAMIVIAIVAILLTGIIPGLRNIYLNNRLVSEVNELVSALQFARSHAVMQSQRVGLCPSLDGETCSGDYAWQHGWIVFENPDGDTMRSENEQLLRLNNSTDPSVTILTGTGRRRIQYQENGSAGGSNTTFVFCDERGAAHARAIVLANSGRPRIATRATDGGLLSCP